MMVNISSIYITMNTTTSASYNCLSLDVSSVTSLFGQRKRYAECTANSDMVGWDNKSCRITWFHLECVELSAVPCGK